MLSYLIVIALFVTATTAKTNGTFVVTAPKIARIGTPYTVSVVLTESRNAVVIGSIVLNHTEDSSQTKTVTFSIDPTENKKEVTVNIMTGELLPGRYQMKLIMGGKTVKESVEIDLDGGVGFCRIQTDKGIYKRSQQVKFRVVCLNADLMPLTNEVDITIIDPDNNKVEMYKKESSNTGVITKEYNLSDDPKLGDWKIQVQQSDGMGRVTDSNFTVDAYVLPRFSVEVKPAVKYVYVKDFSSVQIEVEAMYTYGEGVHGSVSIECTLNTITTNKRAILVDGKATFTISTSDIGDPSRLKQNLCYSIYCYNQETQSYPMEIHAKVREDETDEEHETETTLYFYTAPADMEFINKKEYRKNMDYTVYLHITDPSGGPLPLADRSNLYVKVWIVGGDKEVFRENRATLPTDTTDVIMKFTTTTTSEYSLNIKAELYDQSGTKLVTKGRYVSEYHSIGGDGVQLSLMNSGDSASGVRSATKVYDIGDTIHIRTTGYSPKGFKSPFYLFIFAKGKQIQSYEIQTSGDITDITITQSMGLAPSASLLLYAVTAGNELVADEMELFISGLIKNQMTMSFNTQRQEVGRDVTLSVNTDPNSNIFLVAIDKGSLLLKQPNDIKFEQIKEGVTEFDTRMEKKDDDFWGRKKRSVARFHGGTAAKNILEEVGVVCITDASVAKSEEERIFFEMAAGGDVMFKGNSNAIPSNIPAESESKEIRKNFPETWIWLTDISGSDGNYQNTFTLPDTITSWVTRGFAISPTNGLGIASNIQVEGFKQFFVVVSLPPSAIRDERMEVKLVVFNYFNEQKGVRVTLEASPHYFIYLDSLNTSQPIITDFTENFQVPAGLSKGTRVFISPKTIGNIKIKVEASTGGTVTDVSDIVEKVLPVDPEGKKQYGGVQELYEASTTVTQTKVIYPEFPTDFVPDSRKVTVAVTGDIMGQSLQNLDSMIRAPYGCGEQNMISLVPNIYALSYMKAVGISNQEIVEKAKKNMRQGYQRELNYKHPIGGYSAFGTSDASFSTWLTAFVMKSFAQASKFIFISDEVLEQAKEAIMSQSNKDGSFNEPGVVHHKDMMTGTSSGAMLTAYVYIALKETQRAGNSIPGTFDFSVTLTYLENFYKSSSPKTPFQMAVLAYCFALGSSQELNNIMVDLNDVSQSTDEGDMKCWCEMKKQVIGNQNRYMSYNVKPSAIETAAYVLLTKIEQNDLSSARPIVKWLVSQINGEGGFLSTQDTVMGLQALSRFAELLSSGNKDITVTFKTPGQSDVQFKLSNSNSILLQRTDLVDIDQVVANGVTVEVRGSGIAVVSVNWEYNINVNEGYKDLLVDVKSYKVDYYTVMIEACVWYEGTGDNGMGMMYVDIPTGYIVSNLDILEKDKRIQRVEVNGRTVAFYFNRLSQSKTCIEIYAMRNYIVVDVKPCPVIAQFYYQPEKQSTTYYTLSSQQKPTGGVGSMTISNLLLLGLITMYMCLI